MGFFSSLRKGLQGAKAALGPGRYSAAGKTITCPHCGGELFKEGSALLVRRGTAIVEAEWASKGATTLLCTRCGRIQWFLHPQWLGPGPTT
jgi:uncharacterized protein with PIN domain